MSDPGSNNLILMIWIALAFAGLFIMGSLVFLIVLLSAFAPSQIAAVLRRRSSDSEPLRNLGPDCGPRGKL